MIENTDDYVSLMTARARGRLPDMGCALRVAELIAEMSPRTNTVDGRISVLDVGCATGHFLRTFIRRALPLRKYVGLEIDPAMVRAANEVWREELGSGAAEFINADLEHFAGGQTYDLVICVNAFMYFASAKTALTKLMRAARHRVMIRSYFTESTYRIVRAQTTRNHDKSQVDELAAFDDAGNILCYDFWNMYSFTYMEALVRTIEPKARAEWIEDKNVLSSLEEERKLNLQKRGATELLGRYEVSYPFILPWKYLSIDVSAA